MSRKNKVREQPDNITSTRTEANAASGSRKTRSRKQVTTETVVTEPEKTAKEITSHTTSSTRQSKVKSEEQGVQQSPSVKKRKVKSEAEDIASSTKPKKRRIQVENKEASDTTEEQESSTNTAEGLNAQQGTPKKSRRKAKPDSKLAAAAVPEPATAETKVKRKRKTKEEKEAEAMPLAPRTAGHKLYIGAHVSASGGVHKAILNSVHIGANAFALFLKSQRKWANPALSDDVASMFHANCKTHTYDASSHIVPHGSYLVNLAHTDADRTKQAYEAFLDDLQRCERLGIKLYNFHPGNSAGNDRSTAIKHLASNLNRSHKETKSVVTLLENMAAGGNIIGTTFEDLRDIIKHVEDKSRVGVCLDTCHAFAAGYDLRTPETFKATLEHFDEVVGLDYLRALHLNDSKAPFGAHRDLHANIGTGFLGLRAFHNIVNEPRFIGLPLVLETPTTNTDDDGEPLKDDKGKVNEDAGTWAREIKLLESLVDMDVASEEYLALEAALSRKGAKERQRVGDQAERRKEKDAKKAVNNKKKKKQSPTEGDESELSDLDDD